MSAIMSGASDRPSGSSGESLWSAAEVADYLKVSRSWVYHRAAAGELPCLHFGALLRFDPEAIRAYARGAAGGARVLPFRRPGDRGRGDRST